MSSRGLYPGAAGGLQSRPKIGFGKVDCFHASLRITGYVNDLNIRGTHIVVNGLDGRPIPMAGRSPMHHAEFANSQPFGRNTCSAVGAALQRFDQGLFGYHICAGLRWGGDGRYTTVLRIANLANTLVQNHVYGDILKRQITGELRLRF